MRLGSEQSRTGHAHGPARTKCRTARSSGYQPPKHVTRDVRARAGRSSADTARRARRRPGCSPPPRRPPDARVFGRLRARPVARPDPGVPDMVRRMPVVELPRNEQGCCDSQSAVHLLFTLKSVACRLSQVNSGPGRRIKIAWRWALSLAVKDDRLRGNEADRRWPRPDQET
jgi:hypothetical protein